MNVFCKARNGFIRLGLKYVESYLCYITVSVYLNLFSLLFPLLLIIPRVTEVSKPIRSHLLYLHKRKRKIYISRYTPPPLPICFNSLICFDCTASIERIIGNNVLITMTALQLPAQRRERRGEDNETLRQDVTGNSQERAFMKIVINGNKGLRQ
jgi:hypothetical protein